MVTLSANFEYSSTLPEVDCKTVGFFFLKISKEIGKAWRKSLKRARRASLTRLLARTWKRKKTVLQSIPEESFFRLLDFSVLKKTKASFSKDFGDGNEDFKKHQQNNNFVRASRFFVHFFAVHARLGHENA